jgi:heat-inducible transcriptional repressor
MKKTNAKKLTSRKKKLLGAVVSDYMHTAEPVSSEKLARKYMKGISTATIRNELASLEQDGFLTHPHTSAGRIPSDLGYRFFVDELMKIKGLSPREIEFIKSQYMMAGDNLEELLHTTLKVAATLSHLLAVITMPKMPFKVLSSGLSNIMQQPEFNDTAHIRNILNVIEHEELMSEIMHEAPNDGVTIRIGSEIKHKQIKDCSIVVSRYAMPQHMTGSISIIGPTRMTYDKVSSIVDTVSKTLRQLLMEGVERE